MSALLFMLFMFLPSVSSAAVGTTGVETWYVRPIGACPTNGDGLAYTCAKSVGASGAFIGIPNIIWTVTTGVDDGDTIYVCGEHLQSHLYPRGASGSAVSPITIDFRCPGDSGSIKSSWTMTEALIPSNWTNESGNIWYISVARYNWTWPGRMWLNGVEIFPASAKAALGTNEGGGVPLAQWWYDNPNLRIYLWSVDHPALTTSSLENLLVSGGGDCDHTALCFRGDTNDYFRVINPVLKGGQLGAMDVMGADNVSVIGTDPALCRIGEGSVGAIRWTDTIGDGTGNPANNNSIENCTLDPVVPKNFKGYNWQWNQGNGDGLALMYGVTNGLIKNNIIKDWGHSNLLLQANSGTTSVTGNVIQKNTISCYGMEYCRAFIIHGSGVGRASNNVFTENTILGQKIRSQLNGDNNDVIGNRWDDHRQGTVLPDATQSLDMEGYGNMISQNNRIRNNTFLNNPYAPCISFTAGSNTKYGYVVENNLLMNCGGVAIAGMENAALYLQDHAWVGNTHTFRNNNIFTAGRADTVYYRATGLTTVARFQAMCTRDVCAGNLSADPLTVSTTSSTGSTNPQKVGSLRSRSRTPSAR